MVRLQPSGPEDEYFLEQGFDMVQSFIKYVEENGNNWNPSSKVDVNRLSANSVELQGSSTEPAAANIREMIRQVDAMDVGGNSSSSSSLSSS